MGMKTAVLCVLCEMCTIAAMIWALACGAKLPEILSGILLMLAVSLLSAGAKDGKRPGKKECGDPGKTDSNPIDGSM